MALACAAAFQAVNMHNAARPRQHPFGGAAGARRQHRQGAGRDLRDLMWTGYNLFRERNFANYAELHAALEAELGGLAWAGEGEAEEAGEHGVGAGDDFAGG